ncbi:MAG: Alpha/Beta hydrolase protein, partial [Olpidium bornovanus]
FVQKRVVQAQYFKDPTDIPAYLRGNVFLPDVNNEDPQSRKPEYKARLVSLNKFVMIRFSEDVTVVPKNSSVGGATCLASADQWFGFVKYEDGVLVPEPLQESELYKHDWLGLRELDEQGRLIFLEAPGPHVRCSARRQNNTKNKKNRSFTVCNSPLCRRKQMRIGVDYFLNEIVRPYLAEPVG